LAIRSVNRLKDFKSSRSITIQVAPQIRMIQNTNQTLVEKIQTSITTAIPLWKHQIAIALTLLRQKKAVEAQKQVSKTTNELLLKNSRSEERRVEKEYRYKRATYIHKRVA